MVLRAKVEPVLKLAWRYVLGFAQHFGQETELVIDFVLVLEKEIEFAVRKSLHLAMPLELEVGFPLGVESGSASVAIAWLLLQFDRILARSRNCSGNRVFNYVRSS